jgi:hypothetical protein
MLSRERVEEMQGMDIDNPSSSRTLDSRALPAPAANQVLKTKRKKGTSSVRRQLQSFARDLTAHQTPRPKKGFPLVVHQSHHTSAPNGPGQWHLATNHQDNRLLSPQVSINNRGQDPLSDISLNTTNVYPSSTDSTQYIQDGDSSPSSHPRIVFPPGSQVHRHCHMYQPQRTGASISNTLRLERTGISTISALLNHDNNNTPATAPATTRNTVQGSEDKQSNATPLGVGTTLLSKYIAMAENSWPTNILKKGFNSRNTFCTR